MRFGAFSFGSLEIQVCERLLLTRLIRPKRNRQALDPVLSKNSIGVLARPITARLWSVPAAACYRNEAAPLRRPATSVKISRAICSENASDSTIGCGTSDS